MTRSFDLISGIDKCENNTNGFRMRDNNNNSDAEERRVRDTPQQSSTSNPKRSTGLRRLSTFHKVRIGAVVKVL